MMKPILASSDGWNWNPPRLIQDWAPLISLPTNSTATSMITEKT